MLVADGIAGQLPDIRLPRPLHKPLGWLGRIQTPRKRTTRTIWMTHPIPASLPTDKTLLSSPHVESSRLYLHRRLLIFAPRRPLQAPQCQQSLEVPFRPECNLNLANFTVLPPRTAASTQLPALVPRMVMTQAHFKAFELSAILHLLRLNCLPSELFLSCQTLTPPLVSAL